MSEQQKAAVAPSKKNRTAAVCTALHVVKGAIVKVFGAPVTTAVTFNSKTVGKKHFSAQFHAFRSQLAFLFWWFNHPFKGGGLKQRL